MSKFIADILLYNHGERNLSSALMNQDLNFDLPFTDHDSQAVYVGPRLATSSLTLERPLS